MFQMDYTCFDVQDTAILECKGMENILIIRNKLKICVSSCISFIGLFALPMPMHDILRTKMDT